MFLPLGTDRPLSRRPVVTISAIAGLVLIHVVIAGMDQYAPEAAQQASDALRAGRGLSGVWRLLTYALLHGGLWHLAGNCLFLWVFGPCVEDRIGRFWYVLFLAAGAVVAGLGHVLTNSAPVIGASGAVSGVTGAFFVLFPRTRIKTFIIFFVITSAMIPAWVFIGIAVARDLFSEVLFKGESNVAYMAHLAGYAFGGVSCALALRLRILKPEVYDLMYLLKQRKRRAEMRAAVRASGIGPDGGGRVKRDAAPVKRDPAMERAAEVRAEISSAVAQGRLGDAAGVVSREMGDVDPVVGRAMTPSRDATLKLAEYCVGAELRREAVWLYERFLELHSSDREAGSARLMAGMLLIRDLDEPARGRGLIEPYLDRFDAEHRGLAESLLEESGGAGSGGLGSGGGGAG